MLRLEFLSALTLAASAPARTIVFEPHAVAFSRGTLSVPAIDPQVFVRDPAAGAATGPQAIAHVAGVRPLRVDDPTMPLLSAGSIELGITSTKWLAAGGTCTFANGRTLLDFRRLIAFGVYTVEAQPTVRTLASFVASADGSARVVLASQLLRAEELVLAYHSDGQDRTGGSGRIGWDEHHQLVARLV